MALATGATDLRTDFGGEGCWSWQNNGLKVEQAKGQTGQGADRAGGLLYKVNEAG